MDEIDECRLTEEDFQQWKEVLGNLEELGDQDSIEEALEKMRNGTWLHVYNYYQEELHIIRPVEMPEGDTREYVFVFFLDKDNEMQLSSTDSLDWWTEQYIKYIGLKKFTLTKEEAMEKLKSGIPIVTSGYIYFTGQVHNSMIPELAGKEFVFGMRRDKDFAESLYVSNPVDVFSGIEDYRYGYRED